jgi:O-acetylserine/cysteine efflux transporter
MSLIGFIVLILISIFFEDNLFNNIININLNSWFLIIYSAILVSIAGHMSLFYLYKLYPVKKIFPFYALFPIFGILQTMVIFNEIPTLIMIIGSVIVISSIYILNKID